MKNAKKSQKVVERFVFLLCIFRAQHIKHAPLLRKESVVQEPYILVVVVAIERARFCVSLSSRLERVSILPRGE